VSAADILTAEELQALAQMFRNLAIAGVVGFSPCANAGGSGDNWNDEHAKLHFAGVGLVSGAVTRVTDSRALGIAAGLTVGIVREEWKKKRGFANYSPSRNFAHIAGSLVGAQVGRCFINGQSVACAWEF